MSGSNNFSFLTLHSLIFFTHFFRGGAQGQLNVHSCQKVSDYSPVRNVQSEKVLFVWLKTLSAVDVHERRRKSDRILYKMELTAS